ncbi:uncharacterized protein LOC105832528 isoform X2 [Monomorium pharaonis]|uniref:uncharacterized protein LOC105832528 isoform X2 n=1 Tax=Monomorium pharaonis TaxID=307658 RepID=UPI00063F7906|nr:uncharacterized protein LOC105832528 isoform X2 [Monomorium pharaonis]
MIDDYHTSQDNKKKNHSPTKEELKKMLLEARKKLKEKSFLKEIDKDSYQLNPPQNTDNLEIENSLSDTSDKIINPIENVNNNTENLKDSDIEIEEFEDLDIQLYGKNFEPKKCNILCGFRELSQSISYG